MTIAEMVYIRNELNHAKEVLHWAKNEGYQYGSKESAEKSIKRWEAKVAFWKNELNSKIKT